ncbi:MAG TPA: hypothetical protein P5234_13585 [Thermoanaerobaculaceae bacterium]|nr:hypothetical protein [Thermoanaerobaculaceae bacterium]HRS17262.1 hypothetical protein [Thermoanaerobaculaceae bacterium]
MLATIFGRRELWRRVLPWPLIPARSRTVAVLASLSALAGAALSRLLLLPDGPWEQDEALLAAGVIDFDPAAHMPLPPGFPLWILLGRIVRLCGAADPVLALQIASSVLSVVGLWALVGLWDSVAGRTTALGGALLAAFLPGVWAHAGRAFSETPATTLAVIAFGLWLRGGRAGFLPGTLAITAAALVRPPLAPLFVVAVALAAWRVRRDLARLAAAAAAAAALVLLVVLPLVGEAGGWRMYWEAGRAHAGEHFVGLVDMSRAIGGLGWVRGLANVPVALAFAVLAAAGWWRWRRALGPAWWPGTVAAAWLAYLLLFVHNPTYPRYWVPAWVLAATPALAGAVRLLRRERLAPVLAVVGAASGAWWAWPALWYIHVHPLPVIGAMRQVADEGKGVLVFEDSLFSFRNLTYRTGELRLRSLRVSEIPPRRLNLGGQPIWFLTESAGQDLSSTVSRVVEAAVGEPRVVRLSQERFLHVRLVRNPVLAWRGASIPELEGSDRFVWFGKQSQILVPPVTGAGALALALEVHPELAELPLRAVVAGEPVLETVLRPGRQILRVPLPAHPVRNRLAQIMPVLLEGGGEIRIHGDYRSLAFRVFRASVEAPPFAAAPAAFFPEESSLFAAVAEAEGFFGPELMGRPARPAVWAGPLARVRFPASAGLVGVEMLAPRSEPADVELRLGDVVARVRVGPEGSRVALPVPGERASSRMVELELRSNVFVPGGGDERRLGVAVSRIWFVPS